MVSKPFNRIMLWNCRGAASRACRRVCKNYLQNTHPDVVVAMETQTNPFYLEKTFKMLGFDKLIGSEVRVFSGGIAMAWKSDKLKVEVMKIHFRFMPMYASPRCEGRKEMWDELINETNQI